ncbi:MAG: ABC transporter ATP-binding protein [Rudaea sp.]
MTTPALQLRGLSAGYAGRTILHGLDLDVAGGEWLALVGPNGSGKSTLLDCASGRHLPSAGSVHIDGFELATETVAAKQRLGYCVAPERLPDLLTGRQCLAVHSTAKQLPGVEAELLELAGALGLTGLLDDPVAIYSYGTRQKIGVLLSLIGEPALVVLDEAFNGLDAASAIVLKRHLRARVEAKRCAIVFATHALDIVERWTDRALLLREGRFVGSWDRAALAALRRDGADGLEAALASAGAAYEAGTSAGA